VASTSVNDNTVDINSSEIASGGGGIYNDGSTTDVSDGHVDGNSVTIGGSAGGENGGGGIYGNGGGTSIGISSVDGNSATVTDSSTLGENGGGAVFNAPGAGLGVAESSLSQNSATVTAAAGGNGGGAVLDLDHGIYLISTLSGNSLGVTASGTQNGGGAIHTAGGTMLGAATIAGNLANAPGGAVLSEGQVETESTILAGNTATPAGNCAGAVPFTSSGFNLDSGNSCGFNATGDLVNTDPRLGPLQNNGGTTLTQALPAGSPAVDAGSCTIFGSLVPIDQRLVPRPQPAGGACDIGAYELVGGGPGAGPPTATITSPPDNQTFNLGQVVATAFSCAEAPGGPGLRSCTDSGGAAGGAGTLDTSTAGQHTYTVTAVSNDGQTGTATIHYTVASPPPSPGPQPTPAPAAPAVSGGAPTSQTSNGASVSGSVNPEGVPTQAFFQYGLDLSQRGPGASTVLYDQSTAAQQVGSDLLSHTITASLTGLVPGALYHVRLVAINAAGTTFGPDHTFTTAAAPAPPPPVVGRSADIKPVSGTIFIKSPSGQFVPLTGAVQIPSGSQIDALHGSLQIVTGLGRGKTQHGIFGGAVFRFTQARSGLATLSLVEGAFPGAPTYATCKAHKAGEASAAAVSSKTLQLLHASAHGKFSTSGRYSAATVRGTRWTIADRCDGTLTRDVTDSVTVADFVRHRTIVLHAGQSYLARAPRRK
jgi:hypothetical protein